MQARSTITAHETARRKRGLGVTSLAAAVGVTHAYVSRVEGQQIPASTKYRQAVARLLGVDEDSLFGHDRRAI